MNIRYFWNTYIQPYKKYIYITVSLVILELGVTTTVKYVFNLSMGDTLSFGQLWLSIIFIPIAVIGFNITLREFSKSQDRPDLDLFWEVSPGKYEKKLTAHVTDRGSFGARPVIINNGSAIAVWYVVHFDISVRLARKLVHHTDKNVELDSWLQTIWQFHVGNQSDWRIDVLEDYVRFTFMSNGKSASYPHYPLPLGILFSNCKLQIQETEWYEIPYTIITNEGQSKHTTVLNITLRA